MQIDDVTTYEVNWPLLIHLDIPTGNGSLETAIREAYHEVVEEMAAEPFQSNQRRSKRQASLAVAAGFAVGSFAGPLISSAWKKLFGNDDEVKTYIAQVCNRAECTENPLQPKGL